MKKLIFFASCLCFVTFCFAIPLNTADFSCPPPQNVIKLSESSGTISFDWNDCFCSDQTFEAYYVKGGQASPIYTINGSGFTFSNLAPGVYKFHFRTTCGSGMSAEVIIEEDIVVS